MGKLGETELGELYVRVRSYTEHQDHLINQRLVWYLTLQGFLFTAFSLSVQKEVDLVIYGSTAADPYLKGFFYGLFLFLFGVIIALVNIKISRVVQTSITASYAAITCLRDIWAQAIADQGDEVLKTVDFPKLRSPGGDFWQNYRRAASALVPAKAEQISYLEPLYGKYPFVHGGGSRAAMVQGIGGAYWIPKFIATAWTCMVWAYGLIYLVNFAIAAPTAWRLLVARLPFPV